MGVQQERRLADLAGIHRVPSAGTAVEGVDAGGELRRREGLGHIVVRPGHQPGHLVHLLRAGGKHDNADVVVPRPDTAADLKSVHVGQHDVQQRHLDVRVALELGQRLLPGLGLDGLIAGPLKVDDHKAADVRLILQHQYLFHPVSSFRTQASAVGANRW